MTGGAHYLKGEAALAAAELMMKENTTNDSIRLGIDIANSHFLAAQAYAVIQDHTRG